MAQDYYFNSHNSNNNNDKDNNLDKPVRRQGASQRPPQRRQSAPSQRRPQNMGRPAQQNHQRRPQPQRSPNSSAQRPAAASKLSFDSNIFKSISNLEYVKEPPKVVALKVLLGTAIVCAVTVLVVFLTVLIYSINFVNGDVKLDLNQEKLAQAQTTFMYAKNEKGEDVEIARLYDTENRVLVKSEDISDNLKRAFIMVEDKRFEKHNGVDWFRTLSAVFLYGGSQGGSTITQQLVKNLTDENSVTIVRKYKEILTALNIEKHYTKDEILEAYMNTVYLSHGCYGVQTAAEKYFGKNAKDLNLAESIAIAAITQWPNKYDLINKPDDNQKRVKRLLDYMIEDNLITQEEYDEVINYDLVIRGDDDFVDYTKDENDKKQEVQSYFIDYVIEDLYDSYEAQQISRENAKKMIYSGGLKVYTTLDPTVQSVLENIYVNKEKIYKDAQSGMVVLNYNGGVVGIVGGVGEKKEARSFNRATAARQPGSVIKPISVYAPALQEGAIYWSKMFNDSPSRESAEHPERPGKGWPKNEGSISYNDCTVQYGLAKSLNTIAVRVLTELSLEKSMDFVKNKAHISTYDEKKDLLYSPLAVGGASKGASPLEMAAAYAMFGNGGYYVEPHSYTKVINGNNEIVFNNETPKKEQVLSPANATIMNKMLQTVMTSGTGSSYRINSKYEMFGKTGTTSSSVDRWFVGGTPYYVAAVWYGYDTPKEIYYPYSPNPCGTLWNLAMGRTHSKKNLEGAKFEQSPDAVQRSYCTVTGLLAKDGCPKATGWYDSKNLPGTCKGGHSTPKPEENDNQQNGTTNSNTTSASTTQPTQATTQGGNSAQPEAKPEE